MPHPSPVRDLIIKALNDHGPKTCRELVKLLGLTKEQVKSCLKDNRTKGKKVFYICGYGVLAGDGYRRPAKYAVGDHEDEPYPNVKKMVRDAKRRAIAQVKKEPENPFGIAMMQVLKKS